MKEINENYEEEKDSDKKSTKEIGKLMNDILNLTKEYKTRTIDDLKQVIIKQINDSKISPQLLKNDENENLAHLVIQTDKYERVEIIIEAYISLLGINDTFFKWLLSENTSEQTPLDICVQFGNKEIIRYMYSILSKTTEKIFGLEKNRKGIFHYAAMSDQSYPIIFFYEKLQKYFAKITIIDVPSELGITPLHCACIKGSKNAVDLLLDLGANINALDNEGNNCLHYAVNSNNPNLLKKLLIRGADKTIKNQKGETPLDLAVKNNYTKLISILETKNCFITNPCSNEHEIVGLRSSHNNIALFVIILFMGLGKWIYLSRLNYVKEGDLQLDIVPFIYEIEALKEICYYGNYQNYSNCTINDTTKFNYMKNRKSPRGFLNNIAQLFVGDTFGYTHIDDIYYTAWAISTLEFVLLFFIMKFMCFSSKIFLKKKTIKKQNSLIELFENNKNICVKCRIAKDDTTVHCIVCNGCVSDFDHHCSWLNICISKKNLSWFRAFLYIFLVYIILNLVFFAYSKYIFIFFILFLDFYLSAFCLNDFFFDIVFDIPINNETYNFTNISNFEGEYNSKTLKYLAEVCFIGINGLVFLGCLYVLIFILVPIIKFRILQCSNKRSYRSERYTEISQKLRTGEISLMKEKLIVDEN